MELSPIAGIRAVSPVMAAHVEREVQPPFALDDPGRMEDDGYNGAAREETERGLEEEEDAEAVDDDSADARLGSMDSDSRVNLFA